MRAQVGATVILTYDLVNNPDWPDPQEDDWLVSWSERTEQWGTAYLIKTVRQVKSEINPRRFKLTCTVMGPALEVGIDENRGDKVYPIVWYSRSRKKRLR